MSDTPALPMSPGNSEDINNKNADRYFSEGLIFQQQGLMQNAIALYCKALESNPKHYDAYFNGGLAAFALNEHKAALEFLMAAINIRPDSGKAYEQAGDFFMALNKYESAWRFYEFAVKFTPENSKTYTKLGNSLYYQNRLEDALINYDKAIELNQKHAEPFNNRGSILAQCGRADEALACFERATELDPTYAKAHYNKSLIYLIRGSFQEGWKSHEWRFGFDSTLTKKFTKPMWNGRDAVDGKTVLLHCEQGLGDSLQFCRYATMVAALRAIVILVVPRPLVDLMNTLQGVTQVVAEDDPIPEFDYYCSLMSLPYVFNTTIDTIPAKIPYLQANPQKKAYWQNKLSNSSGKKLLVGLVWAGGHRPNQPELHATNRRRNIPLEQFSSLKIPGVEFISLQKGAESEADLARLIETGWNGPDIADFSNELQDFSDTAALLENLDLLISVDTSTAHLAGALGKNVWLLNRFDSCWRWLSERLDSPWYPTLTLFRQSQPNNWTDVITQARIRLIARAENTRNLE